MVTSLACHWDNTVPPGRVDIIIKPAMANVELT